MKPILIILIAFGAMTFIVNSMLKVDAKVTFLKAELAKEKALKESYIMELGFVDSLFRDCAEANKDLSGQNEKLWNYLNIKIDNEFKKRRENN